MSTPEPDRFGWIASAWDLAEAVADEIHQWSSEYLRAFERQRTLTVGQTAKLNRPVVRHASAWRPEEQVPACVVWPAGESDHLVDPYGNLTATVEIGVAIIVGAPRPEDVGALLHRHTSAVRKLLLDRPAIGGGKLRLDDADYTGIDLESRGRTLAQTELRYLAAGVPLGRAGDAPGPSDEPRDDPLPPWPPGPTVATTHLTVDTVGPSEPLEPR